MNGWPAQNADHLVLVVLGLALLSGGAIIAVWRHDLAKRKRAERQLLEQGELRRLLFDQAPIGVALGNLQLRFLEVNEALCQMLGYTREELLQRTLAEVTHPADRDRTLQESQRVARGEVETILLDQRYHRKDGSILEAMTRVGLSRGEAGAPRYLVAQITDITGRRRAESELQIHQRQLATILENASVVLFAIDAQGIFTLVEGAGLKALERKPGESVGQSIFDRYAARPDLLADVRRGLAGESFSSQREIAGLIFETNFMPLRDRDGKICGLTALALDITARERAGQELKKMERQLLEMQKLESLGVLAGGMANDFNNLLTSILGNASLVRLALGEAAAVLPNIDQIEQASRTAAGLCQQLLAYSGRGRLEASELNVSEVIQETSDRLLQAAGSQVRLQFELAPQLPTIMADPAQLRQVLLSLVHNAVRTLPGGADNRIQLATRLQKLDAAWLAEANIGREIRPGEYVCVQVSDNGPGLSPETQARLFDPFFSTDPRERGLGVAAALGIMRSHQGALKLRSRPDGTSFTLAFPPHARRNPKGETTGTSRQWRGHGLVLIVDDEEAVRSTAAQMTAYYGFEVRQAGSGEQALEIVSQSPTPFDLVLLDLTMPGMDGFATFSAIRRQRPGQRIVVFSGYSEQDARQRFAGQNLNGFLQKPFTAEALREILRLACPG